jgi:hypothetical protein
MRNWHDIQAFDGAVDQALSDYSPALPEEPIGAGARWEVTGPVFRSYIGATLTRVHELTALDGERCVVSVTAVVRGEPYWIQYPNSVEGDRNQLLSMSGQGSAELEFRLDAIPIATGWTKLSFEATILHERESRGVWKGDEREVSGSLGTALTLRSPPTAGTPAKEIIPPFSRRPAPVPKLP